MSDRSRRRPNVLLIMSDQHNRDFMGCAGHPVVRTPALDALAEGGVRFTSAYCNYPLCCPSRMSFMTGRYASSIDCMTNRSYLNGEVPTFAHAFLRAGYDTAISGRMHFAGYDQLHGFGRRLTGEIYPTVHAAAGWRLHEVLGDLADTSGSTLTALVRSGAGRSAFLDYDADVAAAAVDYLKNRSATDPPFLLTAGFMTPHCPYVAPERHYRTYQDLVTGEMLSPAATSTEHPYIRSLIEEKGPGYPPGEEVQRRVLAAYCSLVTFGDELVARMVDQLEASGLADETIVVYTSDHGDQMGRHALWAKRTFYEGSIGVPLIVSAPGRTDGARVRADNVSLMDLGSTLLDLAGVEPLENAEGVSFADLITDERPGSWHNTVIAENSVGHRERLIDGLSDRCSVHRMIKRDQWKYCYYQHAPPQLFDLNDDPAEDRNLSGDPAFAEIATSLETELLRDWDPEQIKSRLERSLNGIEMLGRWTNLVHPEEPQPRWSHEGRDNYLLEVGSG